MQRSHPVLRGLARVTTVAAVALTILGIGTLITGAALYVRGPLGFPLAVQVGIVLGAVGLGAIPCFLLLQAARLASGEDAPRARSASLAGGLVLLPGIGLAAIFRLIANPCWDNPTCTTGSPIEDGILTIGILILLLAAAVALLLSPLLFSITRRPLNVQ
jgi:hypothetical protein